MTTWIGIDSQVIMTPPNSKQCFEPTEQLSDQIDTAYIRFKETYPLMRTLA